MGKGSIIVQYRYMYTCVSDVNDRCPSITSWWTNSCHNKLSIHVRLSNPCPSAMQSTVKSIRSGPPLYGQVSHVWTHWAGWSGHWCRTMWYLLQDNNRGAFLSCMKPHNQDDLTIKSWYMQLCRCPALYDVITWVTMATCHPCNDWTLTYRRCHPRGCLATIKTHDFHIVRDNSML